MIQLWICDEDGKPHSRVHVKDSLIEAISYPHQKFARIRVANQYPDICVTHESAKEAVSLINDAASRPE